MVSKYITKYTHITLKCYTYQNNLKKAHVIDTNKLKNIQTKFCRTVHCKTKNLIQITLKHILTYQTKLVQEC